MSPSRDVCCSQCATARSRLVPLARLPAVDPLAVRAGAGVARLTLEVDEACVHRLHDHFVGLGYQARPVALAVSVTGFAGEARIFAQGGVEDRDGLREGQGQVEEQRALPRLARCLGAKLALAFRCGLRLGGQQACVDAGRFLAAAGRAAQGCAVGGLALAEQEVVRLALDLLARGEAERLRARAPPAAWRLAALLAWLDVISGRVHCQGRVDLLPHVIQVVALAEGADDCQGLPPLGGGGGTDHDHQMVHGCDEIRGS